MTNSAMPPMLPQTSSILAVVGVPRMLLRLEGLAVTAASLYAYHALGSSWAWFVVLLLVPDLSMLAYLSGPRLGAIAYNAVHTYASPAVVAALAWAMQLSGLESIALIWIAHIGIDRAMGYGLKYATAFSDTHLGRIGRVSPAAA